MQILLLQPVRGLGEQYSVTQVPDGYAMNNLIPKKLAIPASSTQAKQLLAKHKTKTDAKKQGREKLLLQLQDITHLTISVRANEKGSLYQSITKQDIIKALQEQYHCAVSKQMVEIEAPIKTTGEHQITIAVDGQKSPVMVQITEEKNT